MGSLLLSRSRKCLRYLNPIWSLSVMPCTSIPAKTLCSRGGDKPSNRGRGQADRRNKGFNRWTDGQSEMANVDSRWETVENRGDWPFPKSVFAAGTAKRTAEILRRKSALTSPEEETQVPNRDKAKEKSVPPERPLLPAEWRKLKEESANPQRFDHMMMSLLFKTGAQLDIAKSLLSFVALETGTLTYELLLRYLTLCVYGGHDEEVWELYGIMCGRFQSLDTGAKSLFIKSFGRSERWRDALSILQDMKKHFTPSPRNYSDIIGGALLSGDVSTAWVLHDEVIEKGLLPNQEMWEMLFRGGVREEGWREERKGGEGLTLPVYRDKLLNILLHMRDNQVYPQQTLANTIKTWFESLPGENWTGRWTSITPKGTCRCCGAEQESIQLSAAEYLQLRERVMADVIQGADVFTKTTPEELESFKAFVKKRPAFDVIIDGLNVANITRSKNSNQQSETLLAVVSELERLGMVSLVLGRKHMLRASRSWDRQHMAQIQQKAHCFFTDNISEDDPFLLYAALHSGNHCLFVSRDLMRDHKASLPDGATRRLFFKWQRGHQLVVSAPAAAGGKIRFLKIPSHDTIIQSSGNSWHIPYDDVTVDRSSYEVPQKWLCLTKTPY